MRPRIPLQREWRAYTTMPTAGHVTEWASREGLRSPRVTGWIFSVPPYPAQSASGHPIDWTGPQFDATGRRWFVLALEVVSVELELSHAPQLC